MSRYENGSLYVPVGKKREKTPYERFAERYGLPPLRELLRASCFALAVAVAIALILFISGLRLKTADAENGVTYRYFGWVLGGKPTFGVMRASDGAVAKIKGGVLYYSDGSVYSGDLENFMHHGKGTLTYADGSVYTGGFALGRFDGKGELKRSDGSGYSGEYRGGLYHGSGTLTVSGEGKYVGFFDNGEKNGDGAFYYENGDSFTGEFSSDMRKNGVYRWSSGESVEGEFDNNMPSRIKKIIYTDSDGATYLCYYDYISGRLSEKQRYTPPAVEEENSTVESGSDAVG